MTARYFRLIIYLVITSLSIRIEKRGSNLEWLSI